MATQTIGRYEVKSELGRGGMAAVYKAYDPRFKREVAIKVLPREFLHDPSFRARFEREAQTIATLEHNAIVPVYDFGEQSGVPYFVMRLMTGGSLADLLKQKGQLTLQETSSIFKRLAPALDYAHSKGVIHRDLKPGNILFDQNGDPYLSDFGIAKLTQQGNASFTGSAIVGTPSYMSPEQAKSEGAVDARSDIYAMGAILFELLTGRTPYRADTPMAVVVKHITDPVPSILTINPNLPAACETLISKAMAKDPQVRYASTGEMATALEMVTQGKPLPTQGGDMPVFLGTTHDGRIILSKSPHSDAPTQPPIPVSSTTATKLGKTPKQKEKRDNTPPWVWAIGGLLVLGFLALMGIGGLMVADMLNPPNPTMVVLYVPTTSANVATVVLPTSAVSPTAASQPTNTLVVKPPTPTTPTRTAISNPATATPVPVVVSVTRDLVATASAYFGTATVIAADDKVQLVTVQFQSGNIKVEFRTIGFQAGSIGTKIRFYYNTLNPQTQGIDYTGISPWSAHYEKPVNVTEICALLVGFDGKVRIGTGNCIKMP